LDSVRGLIKSRSGQEKEKEEEEEEEANDEDARSCVRRQDGDGDDDDSSGGDDLLSRAFARTREIADLRHALPRKSGCFVSVNASAESKGTRGRTERRSAKKKEVEDQEE
jgi:hypothetical protein